MARKNFSKTSKRIGRIESEMLESLSGGDLAYGFLLSGRSTRSMYRLARERAKDRYRRRLAIERLQKHGYVEGKSVMSITISGSSLLYRLIAKNTALIGKKVWDKKWRIVAFDIPERHRTLRNMVRRLLKRAGFKQLQQSIWIFPHDCEELVQLIKSESRLSSHILYGVLERIEDEKRFRKVFNLE